MLGGFGLKMGQLCVINRLVSKKLGDSIIIINMMMFYKFTSENVRRILITPKTKFTSSPRSGGQIMGDFVFPEKRIIMF